MMQQLLVGCRASRAARGGPVITLLLTVALQDVPSLQLFALICGLCCLGRWTKCNTCSFYV